MQNVGRRNRHKDKNVRKKKQKLRFIHERQEKTEADLFEKKF
jgi:hypothetical protein